MADTLADHVRRNARTAGAATALICDERWIDWAAFDRSTSRVANALIADGVGDAPRFAYLCRNSDHAFELIYGAFKAGAVPVGINWRLSPREAAFVIEDSQAQAVFTDRETLALAVDAAALLDRALPIICLDGCDRPEVTDYARWRDAQSNDDPHCDHPDAVAVQLYTSGTTGNPKGVLLTHANFVAQRRAEDDTGPWMNNALGDPVLVAMPVYHVGGLAMGTTAIAQTCAVIVSSRADADSLMDTIERHRVVTTFLVPAALQALLDHPDFDAARLASLNLIRYGAAPMSAALLRRLRAVLSCDVINVYGMTEATGAITCLPPADHVEAEADRRLRSVGTALADVEITIRDDAGNTLPTGSIGEVCIRSETLMRGYWRRADETDAVFHGDWYRSGDAGSLDADGYLTLGDRLKDMIISGGENIYPAEVETVLAEHPAVLEVAVVGIPDDRWGETVRAVVALRAGHIASEQNLVDHAKARLAGFKVPRRIDFIAALPRNAAGKVLRRDLRESTGD